MQNGKIGRTGIEAAGLAGFGWRLAEPCANRDRMTALDSLQAADFSPHLGQTFPLQAGETALNLTLHEVKVLGHRRTEASRDPFSLEFHGLAGLRLPQGIYALTHPSYGRLDLFVTQIGLNATSSVLEVIFT